MSFNIWNNLDEVASFLGLERLDSETNESFYNRILKFGKWKYKTDYYNQVHSIPLQLGLDTYNIVSISCSGSKNFKCKLDWEYFTLENEQESIRVFIGTKNCTLNKILDAIDNSSVFSYTLRNEVDRNIRCEFLIRNSNIKRIDEVISSNTYRLSNNNIVIGSIKNKENINLNSEKNKPSLLKDEGDYFIEYDIGYIEFLQNDFDYGVISYEYYDKSFYIESTDINLIPLNLYSKNGISNKLIELMPYVLNRRVWG